MNVRRVAFAVIAFACAGAAVSASAAPSGAVMRRALAVKGMKRTYVQYVPRNLKPNAPLLFVFHGSGGDGEGMREITGEEFDMLADANGFVVIYPDGFQTTWNDCRKASPQPARRMNIDDKSFIDAMIEKQVADNRIDRKRIFAAGWSNGGQLAYRLALETPGAVRRRGVDLGEPADHGEPRLHADRQADGGDDHQRHGGPHQSVQRRRGEDRLLLARHGALVARDGAVFRAAERHHRRSP